MNPRETLPALSVSKERRLGTVGGLQDCTNHHRTAALFSACYDQAGPRLRCTCSVEMSVVGTPWALRGMVTMLPPRLMNCLSPKMVCSAFRPS